MIEDVLADVCIDGTERVVQEVDIGSGIDGTSQCNSRFLTTTEGYTFLANLGEIALLQDSKIGSKSAGVEDGLVKVLIESVPENNVVFDGGAEDERGLGEICDVATDNDLAVGASHLADWWGKGGRSVERDAHAPIHEVLTNAGQQTGLAITYSTQHSDKFALLDRKVNVLESWLDS